jgi:PAS domain S-box-containing protein
MISKSSPALECEGAVATPLLLDELPDGVLVMTATGVVASVNSKFLEMVGRDRADVVGRPIEGIVAEEDILQLVGVEGMFKSPVSDCCILFVASDGTTRRLLVCSAKSRDSKRTILTARAVGLVQEELASTTRWAASEGERAQALTQARDALTTKNVALHAAQAELEAAYARLQGEVAARERVEGELRLAQKLEGIGQLAAGIAHEINTPMQYIGDNVAFLARAFEDIVEHVAVAHAAVSGEDMTSIADVRALLDASTQRLKLKFLLKNVPKALEDSKAGIEHVSGIVRAMKSFAHVDQNEKASGDVNQAIRDTIMIAQSEYKSVAVVETELGELPPVTCFLGRLNQVFLNLIVNAAHAIAEAQPTAGGKIHVSSHARDGIVVVTISDNGAGIPEHIQHRVFEQFFTTKPVGKGTGQGLSLARGIVVDAHGGTIAFETKPSHGTAFTIRLPVDGRRRLTPDA